MKHYYEKPTQVKFRDPNYELMNEETEEDRPWIAGIADGEYMQKIISIIKEMEYVDFHL